MSLRQLAQMAGISNPYLSQIERGLREPSERVVDAIARTLELSADQLSKYGAGRAAEPADESPVVQAIRADPALTARQRSALIEVYDAFTGRTRRRRG